MLPIAWVRKIDGFFFFFFNSMQDIYLSQHPLASNVGRNSCMDSTVHRKDTHSSWLLKPGSNSATLKSAGPECQVEPCKGLFSRDTQDCHSHSVVLEEGVIGHRVPWWLPRSEPLTGAKFVCIFSAGHSQLRRKRKSIMGCLLYIKTNHKRLRW